MTSTLSIGSTASVFAQRRDALIDLRTRLDAANQELSTGRTADVHRALGSSAVEVHRLRDEAARTEHRLQGNTLLSVRLDATEQALNGAADTMQAFLEVAVPNLDSPSPTASALRDAARMAYDALVNQLNASIGGTHLFAGVDTDGPPLVPWDEPSPQTALSPRDVLDGILAGGLAGGADAAAKAAEVAASFAGANGAAPDRNFERSFFVGTPVESAPGQPSERLRASVDDSVSLAYGVQANDPAIRSALQGLAMIASVDAAAVDAGAYAEWVATGIGAAAAGLDGIRSAQARLGGQQATLGEVIQRQEMRTDVFATQIGRLEGVDPYEAASRVTMLSTQLEASFASTSRLMRLSFLNYM